MSGSMWPRSNIQTAMFKLCPGRRTSDRGEGLPLFLSCREVQNGRGFFACGRGVPRTFCGTSSDACAASGAAVRITTWFRTRPQCAGFACSEHYSGTSTIISLSIVPARQKLTSLI